MTLSVRRLPGNPIIRPFQERRMGGNVNGPSLIRTPDWLAGRRGTYHLYFAHHLGSFIRLAYADRLVTHRGRVPDGLFANLKAEFSEIEILELTYITCLYDMHAVMSKELRTEFDDRDDPITEVEAPEGFDALDFLGGERKSD